jgi:hypothetical protein
VLNALLKFRPNQGAGGVELPLMRAGGVVPGCMAALYMLHACAWLTAWSYTVKVSISPTQNGSAQLLYPSTLLYLGAAMG